MLFKYLSLNVFEIKFLNLWTHCSELNFLVSKVQFVRKSEFFGTINFWHGVGLLHKNHFNLEFENKEQRTNKFDIITVESTGFTHNWSGKSNFFHWQN